MWILLGLILGGGLAALIIWLHSKKLVVKWYEWLLAGLGLALLAFAMQNYFAARREFEPTAPGMFLLTFALPALILLLLAVGLALFRFFRSKRKVTA